MSMASFFTAFETPYATPYSPGASGPSPVIIPPDFISAIGAALLADSGLCAAIGETGTTGGLKVWQKLAPRGVVAPWVSVTIVGQNDERVSRWGFLSTGILQVSVFATTDVQAYAIAQQIDVILSQDTENGTVVFDNSILMSLAPVSPLSIIDPDPAPIYGRIWQQIRQYDFMYSKQVLPISSL